MFVGKMKFDVTILIVPISLLVAVFASSCDREFNLYDIYGPGYEITCKGLDQTNLALLEHFTVANEIILKIQNSTFQNISSKVFRSVGSIKYLYLENSTFTFPESEAIFSTLDELEYLSIIRTAFSIDNETFSGLKSLKDLILSDIGLHIFPEDCFRDLEALNNLQITQNFLQNIDNIPFCHLDNLRTLNLSHNAIQNLSSQYLICETTDDSLIDLSLNDHKLSIQPDNFASIDAFSSNLNDLDLSYNNLKSLGYYLNSFRYLRILNLQGNQLTKVKKLNFRNLNSTEEIYLNNNQIKTIERNTFIGKDSLLRFDLSNNRLHHLVLDQLTALKYLNLGHNNLTEACLQTIDSSLLEFLLLNNNNFSDIKPGIFNNFSNLRTLDLSNNHIKLNNHSFMRLSHLEILKMSDNDIVELPGLVFESLKNLENLDLSRNKLSSISNKDTFRELENLQFLNLSHNYLENLEYSLLESTKDLRVLDIENNRLHSVQYEMIITHLPLLSVLNIRSNLLSCEKLADIIKYLKDRRVNFTTQHSAFEIDEENIAGIYCKTDKSVSLPNSQDHSGTSSPNFVLSFSIVVVSICFVIITGVSVFRIFTYIKRRKYRADEFELINE
ncbi:unnamed protein product [Phaedon cochleariae]|uniref:Uncharacterized protein n=1 Tax=Phaedon cochleariae TaxID=80249 RepID=A0A9P0GWJ0_PHACE|nr:unnamed protein product [Phaedon cochleariae]